LGLRRILRIHLGKPVLKIKLVVGARERARRNGFAARSMELPQPVELPLHRWVKNLPPVKARPVR